MLGEHVGAVRERVAPGRTSPVASTTERSLRRALGGHPDRPQDDHIGGSARGYQEPPRRPRSLPQPSRRSRNGLPSNKLSRVSSPAIKAPAFPAALVPGNHAGRADTGMHARLGAHVKPGHAATAARPWKADARTLGLSGDVCRQPCRWRTARGRDPAGRARNASRGRG